MLDNKVQEKNEKNEKNENQMIQFNEKKLN